MLLSSMAKRAAASGVSRKDFYVLFLSLRFVRPSARSLSLFNEHSSVEELVPFQCGQLRRVDSSVCTRAAKRFHYRRTRWILSHREQISTVKALQVGISRLYPTVNSAISFTRIATRCATSRFMSRLDTAQKKYRRSSRTDGFLIIRIFLDGLARSIDIPWPREARSVASNEESRCFPTQRPTTTG